MTSRLNISVPATLTVLGGDASLSSLAGLSPGITVSGAGAADVVTVVLVTGNTGASLAVTNAAGASTVTSANTLSLTGTQSQVNAALATLQLHEPVDAPDDVLHISATDTAAIAAASALAVDVVPDTGPAFVAPPLSLTVHANTFTTLGGLYLSDPVAEGLAAMGLGGEETLNLTLSVAQGVLLLPGFTGANGIAASGLGTGTIELSLNAHEIGGLNTLLAGLEFYGPTGTQHLQYALWNAAGVLPREVTYGQIFLHSIGTLRPAGVLSAGSQTLIASGTVYGGTLDVSGITSVLGTLGGGAIAFGPGEVLTLPYDGMSLSGSSLEFGTVDGQEVSLTGTLLLGGPASFAGGVTLGPGALLEFGQGFTAYGAAQSSLDVGLSLGAGAVVEGNGTITVGNFSQSGVVQGGTLKVLGGETLELDASWVTGGTVLQVASGGVLVAGPVSPLFGVFDTTPLTVDSSVTLSFLNDGGAAISGGYAGTLGGAGGAFVIAGPQYFSGTVTGFLQGDALIFPDLSDISLYNIGSSSFSIAGLDVSGNTVTYTIHTSIGSGYMPAVAVDAQGDEEVYMRPPTATVTQGGALTATPGVPQPLLGASINITGGTTQSLAVTLTASVGQLSLPGGTAASRLILTAASIGALNAEIETVSYSSAGAADTVLFTSNTGLLASLQGNVLIGVGTTGTVAAYGPVGMSQANMVLFAREAGVGQVITPLAVGGVEVSGTVDFEAVLHAVGYGGTALLADAGGEAIFGAGANVSLGADVTLGDAAGAGRLVVLTDHFAAAGNVTLAQAAAGAGAEADILGAMNVAGAVAVGRAGAATLLVDGDLQAGTVSVGAAGTLSARDSAQISATALNNGGTILLGGAAQLIAGAYQGGGGLDLGGTAAMDVLGLAAVAGAAHITIGTGAKFSASTFAGAASNIADAGLFAVAGTAALGGFTLQGGTLAAASLVVDGMLSGTGMVAAGSLTDAGAVLALGGRLVLAGGVSDLALLEIGAAATLEIGGSLSGGAVSFAGADGELVLDDAAGGGFSATQMVTGDAVDLIGIATSLVVAPTVSGGTGYILDSQGGTAGTFGIVTSGTVAHHISLVSDGAGGTLITLDGKLPCFARGTGILGPHGYRKVEDLRPDDPVITAQGERRPVRWIGWRTLDLGPAAARAAQPVLIRPHAFGPGRPGRELRLSPSHCVLVEGVLIPVTHLVNGATIVRERARLAATYFHIELDRHDILLAEGLACESYFDDGNRAGMYREMGRRCPARRLYAPLVTSGAKLASVRRGLHERAEAAGFAARFQPWLRGVAEGQSAVADIAQAGPVRMARLRFAAPVRELALLSSTSCPADTDPDSQDQRELGVCLGRMPGVTLGRGWLPRAPGDKGRWMGARAALTMPEARGEVCLRLAAVMPHWHGPAR